MRRMFISVVLATLGLACGAVAPASATEMDVVGLALHEAEIDIIYSGRLEQLRIALAQQSLKLGNSEGQYTLELGTAMVAGQNDGI